VIGKTLVEHVEQDLVEERDAGTGVQVEQALVDDCDPVLLIVSHAVDSPERSELVLSEPHVLAGKPHMTVKCSTITLSSQSPA